jgi:anthranilate/para-aminobenzoate synthase component II
MLEGKYSTRRQFVKAIDRAIVVAPGPKTSKVNSLHKLMPFVFLPKYMGGGLQILCVCVLFFGIYECRQPYRDDL